MKYIKKYEPYRTEWRVFDEKKLLAGTVDMVYKKSNNEVIYYLIGKDQKNYKLNGEIEKENPFENCLKGLKSS